jgi:hypothetical protein
MLKTITGLAMPFALALSCATAADAGTLVASGDEWQLSNFAYDAPYAAGTQGFVAALANTFGGSNYLFLTGNGNVPGSALSTAAAQFTSLGKTVSYAASFNLAGALAYDAVFHFGQTIDPTAVKSYVDLGRNAYVSLGSGFYGSAAGEAAVWNPVLASYGLVAGSTWFPTPGFVSATVTAGPTTSLIWGFGQSVDVVAGSPIGVSYLRGSFAGGPTNIGLVGSSVALVAPGVPEPATWAMMVLAFGAIGAGMRRSRTATAFAPA